MCVALSVVNIQTDPDPIGGVLFDRCVFRRNRSENRAAILFQSFGDGSFDAESRVGLVINQCRFVGNEVVYQSDESFWTSGAVLSWQAGVRVYNSLFYGNRVPFGRAAAFADLAATRDVPASVPVIQNSIFWNNSSELGDGPNATIPAGVSNPVFDSTTPRTIRNSIVEGAARPGAVLGSGSGEDIVENVIDEDPRFVDPLGPDGVLGTADDDFRLAPNSPAIDAGTTELPLDELSIFEPPFMGTDALGNARLIDDPVAPNSGDGSAIDIGPFELTPAGTDRDNDGVHDAAQIAADPSLDLDEDGLLDATEPFVDCDGNGVNDSIDLALDPTIDCDGDGLIDACRIAQDPSSDADGNGVLDICEELDLFVDDDAPAGGDGRAWATALASLDDALDIAASRSAKTVVRVAEGTYHPTNDAAGFSSFQLSPDTHVLGGFAGLGAADPDERDPGVFVTRLSGIYGTDPDDGSDRRALHVVTARAFGHGDLPASISGVTITEGDAASVNGRVLQLGIFGDSQVGLVFPLGFRGSAVYVAGADVVASDVTITDSRGVFDGTHAAVVGPGSLVLDGITLIEEPDPADDPATVVAAASDFLQPNRNAHLEIHGLSIDSPNQPISLGVGNSAVLSGAIEASSGGPADALVRTFASDLTVRDAMLGDPSNPLPIAIEAQLSGRPAEFTFENAVFHTDLTIDALDAELLDLAVSGRFIAPTSPPIVAEPPFINSVVIDQAEMLVENLAGFGTNGTSDIRNSTIAVDDALVTFSFGESIFTNNVVLGRPDIASLDVRVISPLPVVTDHNVFLGASSLTGVGNVDADPGVVDVLGPDGVPRTGDENYALAPGSPAIDAGSNPLTPASLTVDIDGNPRFVDDPATPDTGAGTAPIIDIGAFEFQVIPVCPGNTDGDGVVGLPDLLTVLANFGNNTPNGPAAGDIDPPGAPDGTVGVNDLVLVLDNFGTNCP